MPRHGMQCAACYVAFKCAVSCAQLQCYDIQCLAARCSNVLFSRFGALAMTSVVVAPPSES
eukprot:2007278-Pyramimonas_sp.AAC.1